MVAYSFAPMFADQVATLFKRQTVRAQRHRHARVGEAVQLYTGMRTRQCRKLVPQDPVCIAVSPIVIETAMTWGLITLIEIDGVNLDDAGIERFATADGFGIEAIGDQHFKATGQTGSARWNMGMFWLERHGLGRFEGVLIRWEPQR